VAGAFFVISIGCTLVFMAIIMLGWNLRADDKGLVAHQIAVNYAVNLLFIVWAPQLFLIFLTASLVTFNFAMMRFTKRQFTWSWLVFGATTAMALYAVRDRVGFPAASDLNIAILWLFFFLTLRRLALVGVQFSTLRLQLSEKNRELSEVLERVEQLASHDDLTGTYNRRFFMQLLEEERARVQRSGEPFAVALFDLDHFKSINDRFGHLTGDSVLRDFCKLVQVNMRTTDRFARFGGEEFVLLMPATTTAEAACVAVERIRAAAASKEWGDQLAGHAVTVSAGVAIYRAEEPLEELLGRADASLYDAKRSGRNRFAVSI
jgi:diguanylate cyclase (GGDEF)-like protein